MERTLGEVYRCITCNISLDGEEATNDHERRQGHKVKRTKIIIVPPSSNGSGGFNLKCLMVGGGGGGGASQGARTIRTAPQSNMLVLTNDGQFVRRRVQTLEGQLIGAPRQVNALVGGSRPAFFLTNASLPRGPPQQVPLAIRAPGVEATVEPQPEEGTVETEEEVEQEETVEIQEVHEVPQVAGISNANLELLTPPQREIIRKASQKPGGGKVLDNKRVLGSVRTNPLGGNKGGRRNFS